MTTEHEWEIYDIEAEIAQLNEYIEFKLGSKRLLIIESPAYAEAIGQQAIDRGIEIAKFLQYVPTNLAGEMESRCIDGAIIHPAALSEEAAITVAHEAGFKIVVLERHAPSREVASMYRRFRERGIPLVSKFYSVNMLVREALRELAEL